MSPKLILNLVLAGLLSAPATGLVAQDTSEVHRQWILEMQAAERGPFARVVWFCNDGSVQPPRPWGCRDHGGGRQHGQWSERTLALREAGYQVANLLAAIDPETFLASASLRDHYAQLLIEKFLIGVDQGWIFRRAMFYRGAIQEEAERRSGRQLLVAMAGDDHWIGPGFLALRTGAQLLPHGADDASIAGVRQAAAALAERDPGFHGLRVKIHGSPDAQDADRVRAYGRGLACDARAYEELAAAIDRIYQAQPLAGMLEEHAARYTRAAWLQEALRTAAAELRAATSPAAEFHASSALLATLREALPQVTSADVRVQLLDLGLRAERQHYQAASELRAKLPGLSRAQLLDLLGSGLRAAYGTGLVNARLYREARATLQGLGEAPALEDYRASLHYLGRAPGWAAQALRMPFNEAMLKLAEIEPLALLFIQDQLRGSPMLFASELLDRLTLDANRLAGVAHSVFGVETGAGIKALNPGLARGLLQVRADPGDHSGFRSDGIYLLPETIAELPPVAGIVTAGEGNPLSHVQLLARNLGIPNVAVDESLLPGLARHEGREVVLAVSRGGRVELALADASWDQVLLQAQQAGGVVITPDLEKLDLELDRPVALDRLRASDSGRTVGPKAAKLGELRSHYPEAVARGVALPFGLFRTAVLERPYPGGGADGPTVWEWMLDNFEALAALPETSEERARRAEAFRAELQAVVSATPVDGALRAALRASLTEVFGAEPWPGLFIRSDTNVEDLPGFTGAGLNLTLPNVVGFEALVEGIPRVWASPFTARAWSWRQALMRAPQHVYTSVLLLESVPVDKSGVLVTRDIDSGAEGVISVAVNEGPGGAVDGQAAESLRVSLEDGAVRVLATATAPWRRVLAPAGGVIQVPSSGADAILQPAEIAQLVAFVRALPDTFPPLLDDAGRPAPADVEFGFEDGELRLFQIRPFLESRAARGSAYLRAMDASLERPAGQRVDLDQAPETGP